MGCGTSVAQAGPGDHPRTASLAMTDASVDKLRVKEKKIDGEDGEGEDSHKRFDVTSVRVAGQAKKKGETVPLKNGNGLVDFQKRLSTDSSLNSINSKQKNNNNNSNNNKNDNAAANGNGSAVKKVKSPKRSTRRNGDSFDLSSGSEHEGSDSGKKSGEWSFGNAERTSVLGEDEMGDDRIKSFCFDGDTSTTGGLALFQNKPQECAGCGNAAIAYTCDVCENYYLCEDCRFTDEVLSKHDPSHTIIPMQESHCNSSRTFGGDSYSMLTDGGSSNLFYNPCSTCKKVIDDTEVVYRCDNCNFLVCENCFSDPTTTHRHELHRFQRRNRNSSVQETVLKTKARSSDGNRIINDYVVVGVLGKGSYAKVKLVQHTGTRELYALKIMRRKKPNRPAPNPLKKSVNKGGIEMNYDDLLREIAVMKFIDHPNVVQLKEVIEDTDLSRVYVIMEYCEKGPVHILGNPPLPLETARQYGSDILKGILHLHHEYLYHRDIKPANCLVDGMGTAKLADFGTCNSIVMQETQQTPAFQCPETFRGEGESITGTVVDSWSFALTLYQMAFGKLPFKLDGYASVKNEITSERPIQIPTDCDPQLRDLLTRMLNKDLNNRMLVSQAASHPFFNLDGESESSRRLSFSGTESQPKIKEDLYARAAKEIRHGKNLNECFHGVRTIRRMRRKEASKTGSNPGEDDEADWLNELDLLNENDGNYTDKSGMRNDLENSGSMDVDELVEQASSVMITQGKNQLSTPKARQDSTPEMAIEIIRSLVQAKGRESVLRLVKVNFSTPPKEIKDVAAFCTEMRLSYNNLKQVAPMDFTVFKLLKDITINGNKLTAFPEEVLKAPRLLRLDLSGNRITNIPPTLRQARFLQRLNLQNNLIREVKTDNNGNSVFSAPSLRHVRLSTNPLKKIPPALDTTTNLTLVLDTIPALMEEWNSIVLAYKSKPPAVVIWDDYFPEMVRDVTPRVWIASNYLPLYKVHTLETCNVQHVVLFHSSDTRFPTGLFGSEDLGYYFGKLAMKVGLLVQKEMGEGSPTSPSKGSNKDAIESMRGALTSFLGTLPPVVGRTARERIKFYFFVAEDPENEEGGFKPLLEFCRSVFQQNESILFFMPPGRDDLNTKDITIGALAHSIHDVMGDKMSEKSILSRVQDASRLFFN